MPEPSAEFLAAFLAYLKRRGEHQLAATIKSKFEAWDLQPPDVELDELETSMEEEHGGREWPVDE